MRYRIRKVALGIVLLGAGALAFSLIQSATSGSGTPAVSGNASTPAVSNLPASSILRVGELVPTHFTLQRLGGGATIQLARLLAGHEAVINLFASWCPACASELGAFAAVSNSVAKRVVFVGIDTNDPNSAKALSLLRRAGAKFPVGIDTANLGVASAFGVANLPTTLYLRADGRLARAVLGAQSATQLRRAIAGLS